MPCFLEESFFLYNRKPEQFEIKKREGKALKIPERRGTFEVLLTHSSKFHTLKGFGELILLLLSYRASDEASGRESGPAV